MPVYFEYFLKASFCLAVIFIFYALLLKRITYYVWNRYFLVTFSILSFIIPLINVNFLGHVPQVNAISFINQIPPIETYPILSNSINQYGNINYWQMLSVVYLLVSSILFIRLTIQLLSITKIKSEGALIHAGEVKIYHLSRPIVPFSFLKSIFINTNHYNENELQEVIDHERVHAEQYHTIDVLMTEIICIINWFNPFAWLIKNAVRENLEFIADDAVIRKGVDKKSYQYLLLKATGDSALAIASSFTFPSLKNRILMMNKTRTSQFHLLKFVLVIPITLLLLSAFRNSKEIQSKNTEVKSLAAETFTLSALTYSIPNPTVKAFVIKEQDQCLLKQGALFNLTMVSNEKNRLKNLLQRNGYDKLNNNAITFLIDSSSADKSFSVQININAEPSQVSAGIKRSISYNNAISAFGLEHLSKVLTGAEANVTPLSASVKGEKIIEFFSVNYIRTTSSI
jgi:hypothetical protein